jgi:hypothetical protein
MAEAQCFCDECVTAMAYERERILAEIDKLKPYLDENGVANWFKHAAYVRRIQDAK